MCFHWIILLATARLNSETIDPLAILEGLDVAHFDAVSSSWSIKAYSESVFCIGFDLRWFCFHDIRARLIEDKQLLTCDAKSKADRCQRCVEWTLWQLLAFYYCLRSFASRVKYCIHVIITSNIIFVYLIFLYETDSNIIANEWLIEDAGNLIHPIVY